jgi:hypothetical protein
MTGKTIKAAHGLGILWMLSILVFLGLIFWGSGNDNFAEKYGLVVLGIVLTGLFAFSGASILYLIHYLFLRNKAVSGTAGSVKRGTSPLAYVLAGVILALIGVFGLRGAYILGQTSNNVSQSKSAVSEITPTPKVEVKYVETQRDTPNESTHQPTNSPQPTSYPPCTINYSGLGAITSYTIPPEDCASKQIEARTNDVLRESYDSCVKNFGAENCTKPW